MDLSLPLVLGVTAIAALAGASFALHRRRGRTLFARLVAPKLDGFEDDFGYDTTYMRFVAETTPRGFLRFGFFTFFAEHRAVVTTAAWYTAKISAALREDCGPCTQLVVRMAEKAGVDPKTLRAVLRGDREAMPADVRDTFDMAIATMDRDLVRADDARERVRARWGDKGVVEIAFAVASSRVYPTVKYGLGYGKACSRVVVGDETLSPVVTSHA